MFDSSFDFFALVVAIVALIIATKAKNQVAALRSRLDAIEGTKTAAWAPVPPPLPAEPIQAAVTSDITPQTPVISDVESIAHRALRSEATAKA